MQRLFIFVALIFVSCSQAFIEEIQEAVYIDVKASYNTTDEGILLGWENQRDFVRVEALRGESANALVSFKERLVQEQWMDVDNIPGRVYYYQLKAYNSRDRQIGQSDIVKGYRSYVNIDNVEVPRDPIASQNEYPNKIELFWVADPSNRFRVYRSSSITRSFELLSELGFNSSEEMVYVDNDVLAGKEYHYKIATVGQDGNGVILEKATEMILGSTLNAPNGLVASKKYERILGGINLTWATDSTVSHYKIYRSDIEDGPYQMIEPYVSGNSYIDTSMPNLEGEYIDGIFTYPSYYYKIKSVKQGLESGFSAIADGVAINPDDYLSVTSLELVLDKSAYPYFIDLSWDSSPNVAYQVAKVDEDGNTNLIESQTTTTSLRFANDIFNTRWEYIVRPINSLAGDLLGESSVKTYASVTPAPPTLQTVTTAARTYITNMTFPNTETHIYWNKKNGSGEHMESMTGTVSEEWVITSEVGFINVAWQPLVVDETIGYYTIYRRKKGDEAFEKVYDDITQTTIKDILTSEQLVGTGSGSGFAYPIYEYQITANFGGAESLPSAILEGFAINPADILPAPAFVSVPFHWADGTGFGQWNSFLGVPRSQRFKKGGESPIGFDHISDKNSTLNWMVLAWGDVNNASTYRVRHSVGVSFVENGEDKTPWYTHGGINQSNHLWINNETAGGQTHMYEFLDWTRYVPNAAGFNVAPINANVTINGQNLIGDERGINFREPSSAPAHY